MLASHNNINSEHQHIIDILLADCKLGSNTLHNALHYHFATPGKFTRAQLALQTAHSLNIDPFDAKIMAAVVEGLHNASLLHDDVQDRDNQRRGQDALWQKFDANIAICAGDYLIARSIAVLAMLNQSIQIGPLLTITNNAVSATIAGQVNDLQSIDSHTLSFEQCIALYEQTAFNKSGQLLGLAVHLPLCYSRVSNTAFIVESIFKPFSISYQIIDDLYDIERDRALNNFNIYNLVAQHRDSGFALEYCQRRVQLLLPQVKQRAAQLPFPIATAINAQADKLKSKLERFLTHSAQAMITGAVNG